MSDEKNPGTAIPGTTEQKPRWEGPPENRPRGYLPAVDDVEHATDAAGESLTCPDRDSATDVLKTKSDVSKTEADQREIDHLVSEAGISRAMAVKLVSAYGTDRVTLEKAAHGLPSASSTRVRSSRV